MRFTQIIKSMHSMKFIYICVRWDQFVEYMATTDTVCELTYCWQVFFKHLEILCETLIAQALSHCELVEWMWSKFKLVKFWLEAGNVDLFGFSEPFTIQKTSKQNPNSSYALERWFLFLIAFLFLFSFNWLINEIQWENSSTKNDQNEFKIFDWFKISVHWNLLCFVNK